MKKISSVGFDARRDRGGHVKILAPVESVTCDLCGADLGVDFENEIADAARAHLEAVHPNAVSYSYTTTRDGQ